MATFILSQHGLRNILSMKKMDKFNQLRIKKSIFIERGDSMTTIKLKVIDENIEFTSSPPIYSGDVNTISTLFDFGEIWEGFTKTAVFYRESEKPYQVVLKDDECLIPHEVMKTQGRIYIGVFGVKDDKVKTSEVVFYDIGAGVMTFGSISEPTDEIWEQILAELGNIRELAEQMKLDQEAFKTDVTKRQENFETKITKIQSDFETTITNKQNNFETEITERQESFEQRVENKTGYTRDEADERFIPTALQGTYTTDLSEEYKGVASDYGAEILKIEGKSEQVTTNGYQLFDASKLQTKTQGGATVTNNGDGSFTVSGSGSLNDNCRLHKSISNIKASDYFKVGKLTFNADGITYPRVFFQLWEDGVENLFNIDLNGKTSGSVEITQDMLNRGNKIEFGIVGSTNQPIKAGTIKPMLYQEGDGTWEPFTGGMPSPNTSYPQEINNALDEPLVSVSRNLCNDKYGYSYSVNYNYISSKSNIKYAFKKMKPKTKYTVFLYGVSFIKKINLFGIKDANSKNLNSTVGSFGGLSKCVFETTDISNPIDNNVLFFSMSVSKLTESEQAELPNLKVMIVEGDYLSDDLPYEPHNYAETNLNFQRMCSLPNGTCDTYENGVSTQRIGLYGFSGHSREDWKIDKTYTDCTRFYIVKNDIKRRNDYTNSIMCNILKTLQSHTTKEKGISSYTNSDYPNQNWIYVNGFNEFTTVEQFKEWLENNPINIQYELETPVVLEVEKPIVPTFYPYTNIFQSDFAKAKIQYALRSKADDVEKELKEHENEINTKLNSYKVKGDFVVINGNINLTNGEGSVDVNYPSGFNKDNCVCIAAGFAYQTAIGYIYDGYMDGGFEVRFKTDRMTCIAYTAGQGAGPSGAKPIRIVLMKV